MYSVTRQFSDANIFEASERADKSGATRTAQLGRRAANGGAAKRGASPFLFLGAPFSWRPIFLAPHFLGAPFSWRSA